MKPKFKIKKNDLLRTLLTETLPYETPISFSNSGFYVTVKELIKTLEKKDADNKEINLYCFYLGINKDSFQKAKKECSENSFFKFFPDHFYAMPTKAYTYGIKKGLADKRFLSIPHPYSQLKFCSFYHSFAESIRYFCSFDKFSLRHPQKIASSYYDFSNAKDLSRFKTELPSTEEGIESFQRYAASFFAYKKYLRLYKFINSQEFFEFEKKYKYLLKLDISHCFDSIYTHSISWATKDKKTAKKYTQAKTFGNLFDTLIRGVNDNETLGIIIGPEFSRIFAEIIFQKIDKTVYKRIKKDREIFFNKSQLAVVGGSHPEYDIRRYVDDYFIFSTSKDFLYHIRGIILEETRLFKLNLNVAKEILLETPFVTPKTTAIENCRKCLREFYRSFMYKDTKSLNYIPINIRNPTNLLISFSNRIKSICHSSHVGISEISPYLIGNLSQRVIFITRTTKLEKEEISYYEKALRTLLGAIFYLYFLSPAVNSSYQVCTAVILSVRFINSHSPFSNELVKYIYFEILNWLQTQLKNLTNSDKNNEQIEFLNLIILLKEIKPTVTLPLKLLSNLYNNIKRNGFTDYFLITSLLFYIENDIELKELKKTIVENAIEYFNQDRGAEIIESETAPYLLFMDLLSCPYIEKRDKDNLVRLVRENTMKLVRENTKEKTAGNSRIFALKDFSNDFFIQNVSNKTWFTNWNEPDLLNLLEKKRKQVVY